MSKSALKEIICAVRERAVTMHRGDFVMFMQDLTQWAEEQAFRAEYIDDIYRDFYEE